MQNLNYRLGHEKDGRKIGADMSYNFNKDDKKTPVGFSTSLAYQMVHGAYTWRFKTDSNNVFRILVYKKIDNFLNLGLSTNFNTNDFMNGKINKFPLGVNIDLSI